MWLAPYSSHLNRVDSSHTFRLAKVVSCWGYTLARGQACFFRTNSGPALHKSMNYSFQCYTDSVRVNQEQRVGARA